MSLVPPIVRVVAGLLAASCCAAAGCQAEYAAATGATGLAGEAGARQVLTDGEQDRVRAALAELAKGQRSTGAIGERGMRWSDVYSAVIYATYDAEMAIVHTIKQPWGYQFELRTIEDYPATLRVRRVEDGRVYEAEASVGRFGDRDDREAALIEALRQQMMAFGGKRSISAD